jgi:hypothetical protein
MKRDTERKKIGDKREVRRNEGKTEKIWEEKIKKIEKLKDDRSEGKCKLRQRKKLRGRKTRRIAKKRKQKNEQNKINLETNKQLKKRRNFTAKK